MLILVSFSEDINLVVHEENSLKVGTIFYIKIQKSIRKSVKHLDHFNENDR